MKRLFISLLLAISLVLVMFSSVSAIQFGEPDEDGHPYVVMCVFDVGGTPAWRTTGFLISPTVVITAGHGTYGTDGARVTNSPDIPGYGVGGYPGPGSWAIEASATYTYDDYLVTPGPGLPGFDAYDVGIVILSQPIELDEYAELPTVGLVDTLGNMAGVDLVGYGVNYQTRGKGNLPSDWAWERERFVAPANIVPSNDVISDMFVKITANPGRGRGGTTFGDSGGPILMAGTNIVIANNSFVNNYNCDGVTYAQRLDLADILSWITGYL
jgi:hypothetical protein